MPVLQRFQVGAQRWFGRLLLFFLTKNKQKHVKLARTSVGSQLESVLKPAPMAPFGTIFSALESPVSQLSNALNIKANGAHGADFWRISVRHPIPTPPGWANHPLATPNPILALRHHFDLAIFLAPTLLSLPLVSVTVPVAWSP